MAEVKHDGTGSRVVAAQAQATKEAMGALHEKTKKTVLEKPKADDQTDLVKAQGEATAKAMANQKK